MIENKRRIWIWAAIIGLLGTCIVSFIKIHRLEEEKQQVQRELDEEIQQGIADEIFRFHVLANSDTKSDQELKMKVKTGIVKYLEETLQTGKSREDTKKKIQMYLPQIERWAQQIIKENGSDYSVSASVGTSWFPEKTYGVCTFPEGEYEALRIEIGEAKGHNWWCVLYPGLCFLEDSYAVVDEEGKKQLQEVLSPMEFSKIMCDKEKKRK